MNFLHVISAISAESGGPSEGIRRIVAGYASLGHTAEVVTLDAVAPELPDLQSPLLALGTAGSGTYHRSPLLRPWLRANAQRFDGIVIHALWQYQGYAALRELAGRYPYLVFTHGMLDPWFNRTYPLKYVKKLPYWLAIERRVLANAKRVLFTSATEARLATESFPLSRWNPAVVPYGSAGPPADEAAQTRAFASATGNAAEGAPFLLYLGRLHEKKGCDILLQAYADVSRELKASGGALPRLVMAGPDAHSYRATLETLAQQLGIAERVLWPGMLRGDAKWGALREAEAFILPSHQENFGIAVAEALSCGTPALISDQVNIHAEVSGENAGLVAADTREGTASLLRRWAALGPDARAKMRTDAVDCWRKHFNSAGTSRAIMELFSPARHGA